MTPLVSWYVGLFIGTHEYKLAELTKAETQFEKMFTLHPDRIEDLDVYSNILHLRGSREKLTALAEKFLLIDKNRPEVCCIVGIELYRTELSTND